MKKKLKKKLKGFAAMPIFLQRNIARIGGEMAHKKGTAHEWNSEEARIAGQKGGRMRGKNARKKLL
jgi:hypothetical protein